ncbi:MAG: hypothetical protein K2W96_28460 [Gemmataceae bacterium]|nr:hypothetical protein [Gemmataceae bacterium]
MLLHEPPPTPFDLRFRLFGTRVRIHPGYWLIALLLGWGYAQVPRFSQNGLPELGLWVLAATFSILLHEFGHVWAGRAFGNKGEILLQSMGGLALGANAGLSRWSSIAVSLAGPAIQLAFWAALLPAWNSRPSFRSYVVLVLLLEMLWFINLYWALLNLLPAWPLDGGQVARELAVMASPRHGKAISLWLSLILSAALLANTLMPALLKKEPLVPALAGSQDNFLLVLLYAQLAVGSYLELAKMRGSGRVFDDPW